MDDYFFDTTYLYKGKEYEMLSLYLDSKCLYENTSDYNEYSSEVKDKYRFEMDYYLIEKIYEFINQPPAGSFIKTEWSESDGYGNSSIEFACLKYYYKSQYKRHVDYAKKLDKLYSSKQFEKSIKKDFEPAFKEHMKNLEKMKD